mmetsp:Transcript_108996/g.348001  ORF Transcript_108996/g.348001 Transcript_108996/m.348001 type:complete len:379 (+) Transcript_108996:2-1138(+)
MPQASPTPGYFKLVFWDPPMPALSSTMVDATVELTQDYVSVSDVETDGLRARGSKSKFCRFFWCWICSALLLMCFAVGVLEMSPDVVCESSTADSAGDSPSVRLLSTRGRGGGGGGRSAGYSKAAMDNRANQMNPNNWRYWSSRGTDPPWSSSGPSSTGRSFSAGGQDVPPAMGNTEEPMYTVPPSQTNYVTGNIGLPSRARGEASADVGYPWPQAESMVQQGQRQIFIPRRSHRYSGAYLLVLQFCSWRNSWNLVSLRRLDRAGQSRQLQSCGDDSVATCTFSGNLRLELVNWRNCEASSASDLETLWTGAWQEHGRCTGWSAQEYFSNVVALPSQVQAFLFSCSKADSCSICLTEDLKVGARLRGDTCSDVWWELP